MKNFSFTHFGEIDLNNLKKNHDISIELNGEKIEIDINFASTSTDLETATRINNFILNIENYNFDNKIIIEKDYDNEDDTTVKDYIDFHVEEMDKNLLSKFIDFDNKTFEPEKQLLKKLKLVRVGLYPDGAFGSDNFAVFDYTFNREVTDQLLVVNTDENNTFNYIAWES